MWMHDGYKAMVIAYLTEVALANCGFDPKTAEKDGTDD